MRPGVWVLGAAITIAAVFALYAGSSTPVQVGRGTPAPDFSLTSLTGNRIVDLDSLSGKVVLVNFWATWCKPCEDEMPAMERLYQTLSGSGFELIAISVDDDRALVESFAARLGLSFPILLDPSQDAARAYQTFRFPESLLVDRDGVVVERYIGSKDWDAPAYIARIRRLLAEPAAG
jgi:peroxiredoxin